MSCLHPASLKCEIDPRSFHVFEFDGDTFMFDRSIGGILRIDHGTFDYLRLLSLEDTDGTRSTLFEYSDVAPIETTIEALKKRGFFQYVPVDEFEQDEMIERLWEHRPRRVQLLMAQGCNLGAMLGAMDRTKRVH